MIQDSREIKIYHPSTHEDHLLTMFYEQLRDTCVLPLSAFTHFSTFCAFCYEIMYWHSQTGFGENKSTQKSHRILEINQEVCLFIYLGFIDVFQ